MDTEPKFLNKLAVTPLTGNNWQLVAGLKFRDANGDIHFVPAGFVTDFASIPSLARLGAVIMLAAAALGLLIGPIAWIFVIAGFLIAWLDPVLNGDEKLDAPAVLHDNGYRRARLGNTSWVMKFYWDWILFIAMRANGEPLWKCWLIWFNVAAFGWIAWYQDGNKQLKEIIKQFGKGPQP
jgi:hypothetical protein